MSQPSYQVRHQLAHRVRIDFGQRLTAEQLRSVIWLLEDHDPDALVRPAAAGHGLVISSRCPGRPLQDPLPRLELLLDTPLAHLPEPPPRGVLTLIRQSREGTVRLLISLAIAGWVLPILPGTPFFLLAWWLGWRPEPRPSASPPGAEAAQPKAISSQGGLSRAERQSS
jgi:hypothetical protein